MAMTLMYNGVQFAPVTTKRSIIVPHAAEVVWSVVKHFGRAAAWMGSVEGQRTFTQLLVRRHVISKLRFCDGVSCAVWVQPRLSSLHTELTHVLLQQGGETVDYVGAVRVFGVADKMLFEQLVQQDNASMSL